MRRTCLWTLALVLLGAAPWVGATEIVAIAYHDIVLVKGADPYAITARDFERQMQYLAREGYHPISLKALQQAEQGSRRLPAKPVLLTFDDGLKSYYERAHPILRRFGFPSVVNVVTSWIDGLSAPENVAAAFMTWEQLREIARSPLVEVLSHTDDLHRSVPANPWGARLPAATTRIYDAGSGVYENEQAHAQRIRADLERSVERLKKELGSAPIGIAWPFGDYDRLMVETAADLGMRYQLTLNQAPGAVEKAPRINRKILKDYRGLAEFEDLLSDRAYRKRQTRLVEIDLAPLVGLEREAQRRALARVLDRLELLRVNTVLVRAFTADGRRTFFHTAALPVAADVLSEFAALVRERTGLTGFYLRVPYIPQADSVYRDLARLTWFNGVVVDGLATADGLKRIADLLRYYKPALKIGVVASELARDVDFAMVELDATSPPESLVHSTESALRANPNTLFLLHRTAQTPDSTLRAALEAARNAGAVHFGYGFDDYEHGAPDVLRIVRALTDHTITLPGR